MVSEVLRQNSYCTPHIPVSVEVVELTVFVVPSVVAGSVFIEGIEGAAVSIEKYLVDSGDHVLILYKDEALIRHLSVPFTEHCDMVIAELQVLAAQFTTSEPLLTTE